MSDKADDVGLRILRAVEDCKNGLISEDQLRSMLYEAAGELEEKQWKIIEALRTHVPEADELTDALETVLRKGSGNA